MVFYYATEIRLGDTLGMMCCLTAFYLLLEQRKRRTIWRAAVAGAMMGLAPWMGFVTAPALVVLGVYSLFVLRPREVAVAAAAGAAVLLPMPFYFKA
jgi:hypothetical protein